MSFAENLGTRILADGFSGLGNLALCEDLQYAFDVILNSQASPVPEPESLALLAFVALAGYGFQRFKKGSQS